VTKYMRWMMAFSLLLDCVARAGDGLPANPMASEDAHKILKWFTQLPEREENRFVLGQDIWAYDMPNHPLGGSLDIGYKRFVESIHEKTGKWLPMIHVSYGDPVVRHPVHPGDLKEVNRHAIAWWKAGGLVHIHINPANPWVGKSHTELAHRERIGELLVPGSESNKRWLEKLDAYAALLTELRDAGVVVLWRPLHEMNFNKCYWYDWGATRSGEVYKDLWRHMFYYFTYEKKLDNLVWVWSAAGTASWGGPDPMSMYPGDDYVDMVGYSQYGSEVKIWPRDLEQFRAIDKPFGFSEFGPAGKEDPPFDNMELMRAVHEKYPRTTMATYWHSWTGVKTAIADCRNVEQLMNDPWVIDRDELDWRETNVDLKASRRRKPNHQAFEFALRILTESDPIMGCPGYSAGGTQAPWLIVNRSGEPIVLEGKNPGDATVRLDQGVVAVHPGASESVTIIWKSPIRGHVSLRAAIQDIDGGVNPRHPGRSDGVVCELRKDDGRLARVVVPDGDEQQLEAKEISVEKGDLVRLLIRGNACHWFDTTRIKVSVESDKGKRWELGDALQKGKDVGNDRPSRRSKAPWWICAGDAHELSL
jgi:mannan endo-1,4-beta-mannosidase